ncbi:uncharacterized protein LOC134192168 [Corticium candelabrum]|uniref:uncharacterized protein LOC134192168 n=1 Tax=Corticium candelabrum TaxID=121492 RepID=UPI002E258838|nr:uncharacterized protein LOC134192168 [Corticium candelabrum]
MSLFLTAIVTLSLALTADANCCAAASYQFSGAGLSARIVQLKPDLFALNSYTLGVDVKANNAFINMTMTDLTGKRSVQTIYLESKTKTQYTVIDNTQCFKSPLIGRDAFACLPSNVKVVTHFTIGGGIEIIAVTYSSQSDVDSFNVSSQSALLISSKCVPIAAAALILGDNTTNPLKTEVAIADLVLFYNMVPLSPSTMTVPSICSKAQSLATSGIAEEDLVLSHLMKKDESFNVFTILSRLTELRKN